MIKRFYVMYKKCNECNKTINKELFWDKFILRARSLRGHPATCACGAGCIITHKLISNHHTINSRQLLNCRGVRSVRPACTTLISNPDVTSATRAVCPYIGMQHGGDYCSLMPRTGRPESLGDEPTWITWFVVNDQKT